MKKLIPLAILLAGCATQSGVLPEGKDGYLVIMAGGYGLTSSVDLRIKAHQQASAFCAGLNKRPETISERTVEIGSTSDSPQETLKFRCVAGQEVADAPSATAMPTAHASSPVPAAPSASLPAAPAASAVQPAP